MMIVIVTGMRDWKNKQQIWQELDVLLAVHVKSYLYEQDTDEFTCADRLTAAARAAFILRHGKSGNVDIAANEWGKERGVTVERFQADWRLPGGGTDYSAGPRRNREMAAAEPRADLCLAFWDGTLQRRGNRDVSGTLDMIKASLAKRIPVSIKPPEEEQPT